MELMGAGQHKYVGLTFASSANVLCREYRVQAEKTQSNREARPLDTRFPVPYSLDSRCSDTGLGLGKGIGPSGGNMRRFRLGKKTAES